MTVDAPVALVCPRDLTRLEVWPGELSCLEGHRYALAGDIPVLLLEDAPPTHAACWVSLRKPEAEKRADASSGRGQGNVDPTVQDLVAATCGGLYRQLVGQLESYPIPELPLPPGEGRVFLDVGCSWGRWCVAAARLGYRVVGVDPSLEAISAARRVARDLSIDASYVVADARHLPFPHQSVDVAFSYSVLQHFAKQDALAAFDEIARVLRAGGLAKLQLANAYGPHSLWKQLRERRFREPRALFDVRYWSPSELRLALETRVGPTTLEADGFFTLNPQAADLGLLPRRSRLVVRASDTLRRASRGLPPLRYSADSLYAVARRTPGRPVA